QPVETAYAISDATAAPMMPREGSKAAKPAQVTASATSSATPTSSGRPMALATAPSARLVLKRTAARSSTRPTLPASAYASPKNQFTSSGATTSVGTVTATDTSKVIQTNRATAATCSSRRFNPATAGSAIIATDEPTRLVSEVRVTATTYMPRRAGARNTEM